MKNFEVDKILELAAPITGTRVLEIVKKIAKDPEIQIISKDKSTSYRLGQNSLDPISGIILAHPSGNIFTPDGVYGTIVIKWHLWPGEKHAVGFGIEAADQACKKFFDAFRKEVSSS